MTMLSGSSRLFGTYGGRYVPETLIPALDELCSRYGDPASRKIYVMSRDVEGRWMAVHEQETGVKMPVD